MGRCIKIGVVGRMLDTSESPRAFAGNELQHRNKVAFVGGAVVSWVHGGKWRGQGAPPELDEYLRLRIHPNPESDSSLVIIAFRWQQDTRLTARHIGAIQCNLAILYGLIFIQCYYSISIFDKTLHKRLGVAGILSRSFKLPDPAWQQRATSRRRAASSPTHCRTRKQLSRSSC